MKNFPDRRPRVEAWRDIELGARMGGGARNPVFKASRRGADLIVRVSGRSEASLAWELDLLEHLAAHGLRVPATLDTEDGRRHDDGVLVQRLIPGNAPRDRSDWSRVVGTLEQVHDMTRQWPQRPGFASAGSLLTGSRGGDVDINAMPRSAAELVRASWQPIVGGYECAVHGDMGASNVLIDEGTVALIDWDEARVDVPAFDFTAIPADVDVPDLGCQRAALTTAGLAWEAATCWTKEPEYAQRVLAELQARFDAEQPQRGHRPGPSSRA